LPGNARTDVCGRCAVRLYPRHSLVLNGSWQSYPTAPAPDVQEIVD
jgi:hypothetical protein